MLRQPGGGAIEVRLDGVVETSYELKAAKLEPVVIRLLPARAATEKVREISITTKGQGTVSIASVAIYNRQSGLTYNSVGYVGAQVGLVNKFNSKLFANDLVRINPHIVVLAFGTNEAFKESLDLAEYAKSYERVVDQDQVDPAACGDRRDLAARPRRVAGAMPQGKGRAGGLRPRGPANAATDRERRGERVRMRLAHARQAQPDPRGPA